MNNSFNKPNQIQRTYKCPDVIPQADAVPAEPKPLSASVEYSRAVTARLTQGQPAKG